MLVIFDDGLVGWKLFPCALPINYFLAGCLAKMVVNFLVFSNPWLTCNTPAGIQAQQQTAQTLCFREKFLLFRTSPMNGNPEGRAASTAWIVWRYKKAVEEQEALGIGRDLKWGYSLSNFQLVICLLMLQSQIKLSTRITKRLQEMQPLASNQRQSSLLIMIQKQTANVQC